MSTAPPIPTKRLRGSVRPGSRVSAARLATVSRPVKASIATGIANAIADQVGAVPEVGALREVVGREEDRKAEHDQEHLADDGERGDRDRQAVEARPADEAHRGHHDDDDDSEEEVGRAVRDRVPPDCVPQVVRHEQARQRDHDHVVEKERPPGQEAELVVERAAHEGRRASGLGERGGPLRVGERDHEEERADE